MGPSGEEKNPPIREEKFMVNQTTSSQNSVNKIKAVEKTPITNIMVADPISVNKIELTNHSSLTNPSGVLEGRERRRLGGRSTPQETCFVGPWNYGEKSVGFIFW